MAPRQGAKKAGTPVTDTGARESKVFKLASNIIDPTIKVRFKSLINRDNKRDACTLTDPRLGLTLLQIAVIADNLPAVEELIALGADVKITISQQRIGQWTLLDAPCKLSQRGAESFWQYKIVNLCHVQTAPEAARTSLFGLIHLAVFAGSLATVHHLVTKGLADVNAPAANTGLTPLMCAALFRNGANRETCKLETMLTMVDVLLGLGGDLSRVNIVGNDFVAIAASMWDRGLWKDIMADPVLLSKCTSRHAGRVALQLFATWITETNRPTQAVESLSPAKVWCDEMDAMVRAWLAAEPKADSKTVMKRLVAELSEPVTQKIVRPVEGCRDIGRSGHAFLGFWPSEGNATTNVLCAIMQCIVIPPMAVDLSMMEARMMIKRLFDLGVKPEAILLPKRPDQGKCQLCNLHGLQALLDVLIMQCRGNLSRHKEVLMDQLWCYFYTCAKHPTMDLLKHPTLIEVKHMRHFLGVLHTHKVDWTDPSAWPEHFVDGKWERVIPIPFLLENIGSGKTASLRIIIAICEELALLGNTDFVNSYHPGKPGPMVYAAREGHVATILKMITCNGNPARQGSDWAEFFMAATSTFRRNMAQTIYVLMNLPTLLPSFRAGCCKAQVKSLQNDSPVTAPLGQSFIRQLAGNHAGFEALLLPLMDGTPSAELLYKQCQLALKAPKNDMRAVLEILLRPEDDVRPHITKRTHQEHVAAALQLRDPKSGVTLLGQAVAWGYDEAIPIILSAIRLHGVSLPPLLDCCMKESKFHKPLFAAVVYGYDNILLSLLEPLSFRQAALPAALLEHVVMERTGSPGPMPAQSRLFVTEPGRGAETIDLLMCAASAGSVRTTQTLIDRGMDPQDTQRFRRNRYYKSAMHAAVEYPDLAMLMWEGGKSGSLGVEGVGDLLPGSKQMRCVNVLLKAGAAMTARQLTIILYALPTLEDPKVARAMWHLLTRHVSACARCGLFGCWSCCHRCRSTSYCSDRCQRKDWPHHKLTCQD